MGEQKKECIALMTEYVKRFQEAPKEVKDEVLAGFMRPRKLEWKGNPNPKKDVAAEKAAGPVAATGDGVLGKVKDKAKRVVPIVKDGVKP